MLKELVIILAFIILLSFIAESTVFVEKSVFIHSDTVQKIIEAANETE